MRKQPMRVAIIGAGSCDAPTRKTAYDVGLLLAKNGYDIVCGGLGGVMEAACEGCKAGNGHTLGILPRLDIAEANPFVETPVATGLGNMRNAVVIANGVAAIAIDGEWGTLSEIALALKSGKKVISIGRWSKLEGVIPVSSAKEAVKLVVRLFPSHTERP